MVQENAFSPTLWSVRHMARFLASLAELDWGTSSTESNIIDGETEDDFDMRLERTTWVEWPVKAYSREGCLSETQTVGSSWPYKNGEEYSREKAWGSTYLLDSRDRKVFIMTGARGLGGEGWAVSLERQEPNHEALQD